jgi:L-alanine-DL-glutamate epimerase-like enolase superfamily enzyme
VGRGGREVSIKITEVRVIGLSLGRVEGTWLADVGVQEDVNSLVEVVTDEGLVGVGSAGSGKTQIEAGVHLLRPLLLGERADEAARVSEKLRQHTFWQGRGGPVEHAISGIDIALWDLAGQVMGQPVARLLGGYYRDRIKPYGSLLFDDDPARLRDTLQQTVGRGFRAIKLGWRPFGRRDRRTDERLVRTAREAVGPEVELMVDAGASEQFWPHGYKWAVETARMLAAFEVVWFEEPLPPDDLDGYVELRRQAPVPIATGEVLTRRQSFWALLERGAVDIVQPDCTKCGGLTEAWRIGWQAYEHNIQLVPHGWNTAVGLAADLHLTAALPVARYVEYLTPSPYLDELVTEPFRLDADGMLRVPTGPGLGVSLAPDALERFAI